MTFFADLSELTYTHVPGYRLLAVGWLDAPTAVHEQGPPEPWLVERLTLFVEQRPLGDWVAAGYHRCKVPPCPSDDEWHALLAERSRVRVDAASSGNGELYVPVLGDPASLFCAPVLIVPYVERHGYVPPRPFLDALQRFTPRAVSHLQPEPGPWRPR